MFISYDYKKLNLKAEKCSINPFLSIKIAKKKHVFRQYIKSYTKN